MSEILDDLLGEIDKEHRRFTLAVFRDIVLATPVDTGRARANWQVSHTDKTSILNKTDKTGGATLSAVRLDPNKIQYVISNNLHYIEKLNRGTSAQAPAKFVERAIKRNQDR